MEFINVILWSGTRPPSAIVCRSLSLFVSLLSLFPSSRGSPTRDISLSLISLITALIIRSLVISAYLSHYLSSEQPWRAGASFSHFISRHARSCLLGTLSWYRSLDSGSLSLSLLYNYGKKGTSVALPRERCDEIAETEPMRKVRTATFRAICVGRGSRAKLIRDLTPSMF